MLFTIVDYIYKNIIPIRIRNRVNINDSKLSYSEIITINIVGELLTIDSERAFYFTPISKIHLIYKIEVSKMVLIESIINSMGTIFFCLIYIIISFLI